MTLVSRGFKSSFSPALNYIFILLVLLLCSHTAVAQDTVPQPESKPAYNAQALCDACSSSDLTTLSRSLLLIADFQSSPSGPYNTPYDKATVASVQQWAMFDLLDLVQKDVRFGCVLVTDRAQVFRPMDPVLPTDRAEIRRKMMLTPPKNGGKISEGLAKSVELITAMPTIPNQDRRLALVLLLSRYPTDVEAIKKSIDDLNHILPTDVHIVATAATPAVQENLEKLAESWQAKFGAANVDRELPGAMLHVYQQLNAFDQSYAEELTAIKAALDKCCKEKAAVCKLLDKPETNPGDFTPILTLIRNESNTIRIRLDAIDLAISKISSGNTSIDIGPLKIELNKLIEELDKRIQLSLTKIDAKLTAIDSKIDKLSFTVDIEAVATAVTRKLSAWLWWLLLLLLTAIGGILFTAIVSRKTYQHVHYHKNHGPTGQGSTGQGSTGQGSTGHYDNPPPKKPGSY